MIKLFNQKEFNEFVIDEEVIGIFKEPITLKSGRVANWYVNWRTIAEDVYLMDKLTDYVIEFTEFLEIEVDCFYGVPEGATKLGVITQFKWAKRQHDYGPGAYRLPMGRGKPKTHGAAKDRLFAGIPKGKTIVLEDTTTTGGSLLQTLDALKKVNIEVVAAIGLTNRNERNDDGKSVPDKLKEKGVQYYAMSNALDLMPEVCRRTNATRAVIDQITGYFSQYGEREITF